MSNAPAPVHRLVGQTPIIQVHDILVHTPTIEAHHIYRVIGIYLGGLGEEGLVELEPLGMSSHSRIMIPHLMLDCMVKNGIIDNVWSLPNVRDQGARPTDAGQAPDATIPRSPASTC
jgi:hypothetical protein